jgi:hypothetical protein
VQHLEPEDYPVRRHFCVWLLNKATEDENLISPVLFSDESSNIRSIYFETIRKNTFLKRQNLSVNNINIKIQNTLPAPATIYKSIDTVIDNEQVVLYPTEFLNSLDSRATWHAATLDHLSGALRSLWTAHSLCLLCTENAPTSKKEGNFFFPLHRRKLYLRMYREL